jgi:pyruvate carboxylase
VLVKLGDEVTVNMPLYTVEAMKMETTITAMQAGTVQEVVLAAGTLVDAADCVLVITPSA